MRLKPTYGSREVAALTGLSARQLQIWDDGGLITAAIPSRPTAAGGHTERRYTPIELFELLVLADLRRRGFSVPQLHAILDTLKDRFGMRLFDATGGGGSVQLLTDGKEIYARARERRDLQPAEGPGAAAACRGRRRLVEGAQGQGPREGQDATRQRIGKIFSRSSAGRGMT